MEHALQLLRELVPTLHFELCEHAPLGIVGHGSPVQQPLREVPLVVPLKDVLVREETKDGDRLVKDVIYFCVRFLLSRLTGQARKKTREKYIPL